MDDVIRIPLGRDLSEWERTVLDEGELYLVGGAVRDMLLGRPATSVDSDYVVTGIGFEPLRALLERYGSASLVGRSFGVVKFTPRDADTVDISLPRTEVSTGPGHKDFEVRYDPSLPVETDLHRRDFTVNSMALDLRTSGLVDPLSGRQDLSRRILRVNRATSFIEDPLRILRGVQFMARFDLAVEQHTHDLMERDASLLDSVSKERVRDELVKLVDLSLRPSTGFVFMHETGILRRVLPELDATWGIEQNEFHPDDVFHHSVKSCDSAEGGSVVRWAALLHDLGKKEARMEREGRVVFYRHEEESARIARSILERLVFPSAFIEKVEHLVSQHMFLMSDQWSDGAVRRFIARVGVENLADLFALRRADGASRGDTGVEEEIRYASRRTQAVIAMDAVFKREDLAIDGSDIMKATGLVEGPEIGRILDALLERVLEDPHMNEREKLISIIEEIRSGGR
jgi:putative nucleotidyltransferase with HDIG domain